MDMENGQGSDIETDTDDNQLEKTTIENFSGVTVTAFSCKYCKDVLSIMENPNRINNYAYRCRGKSCYKVIAENPTEVFFRCNCSYAPFVCQDCLVNTNSTASVKPVLS